MMDKSMTELARAKNKSHSAATVLMLQKNTNNLRLMNLLALTNLSILDVRMSLTTSQDAQTSLMNPVSLIS